jgi:PAS domain S-box-containing protein
MVGNVTAEDLRRVVERLRDGLILFDRGGTLLYLNAEAARILGRPASELVGKPLRETMPEVVYMVCESSRARLLAGEEVLLIRSFFAVDRWFEVLGRPAGDSFLVHFHDITERLQAEAAGRQSEERFQILVNGVQDYAIIMLDPKGQIASWNAGAERISGYSAEEILGKPLLVLFPPELVERGEPRRRLEEAVRRGSFTAETQFFRKNGSPYLARSTYTSLFDDLGVPSGFAVVTHDVTKQRKMEESLRTNEEHQRLAVEAGAVGTWEEIVGEELLVANRQFLEICRLPLDRQPRYDEFLAIVHPDDRDYFEQKRRQVLAAAAGFEFEFEYRVTGGTDRRARWVESRGRVLETLKGSRRIIGVLRDRTRRHEADEFRKLAAGMVAHDLRSPLSAVRLASQILIEHDGLSESAAARVRTIVRKVDRMVEMVERLLRYTQVQFGGGILLDKAFTDLEEVCRSAISDVKNASPQSKIHFMGEGDCHGVWDRIGLIEVATNLVGNAVQHGQRGEPIYVFATDEGDHVVLQVRNLGPPIPKDVIPVIFEPFRRVHDQHRPASEGIGLGLYIVREIVATHGGTVEVSSSAAAGTMFTVRLPRGTAAHPSPP